MPDLTQKDEYIQGLARMIGSISDTEFVSIQADSGSNGLVCVDHSLHEIHDGNSFVVPWSVDVPANDVLDLRFITPDTTTWSHMTISFITEAEFLVSLLRNISITTSGTSLTPGNRNHNSTNTSGMTIDYITNVDLTAANADTDITSAATGGKFMSGTGRTTGGEGGSRQEFLLKQNTGYCLRFENKNAATKYANFRLDWNEVANKN